MDHESRANVADEVGATKKASKGSSAGVSVGSVVGVLALVLLGILGYRKYLKIKQTVIPVNDTEIDSDGLSEDSDHSVPSTGAGEDPDVHQTADSDLDSDDSDANFFL